MSLTKTNITHIGDPFVLNENGIYYMYATHSEDGITVWKGTDLNALTKVGLCYTKKNSFGNGNFWAPEVVKRYDGKYIMHFTAHSRQSDGQRTGVAISNSPLGPFEDVFCQQPMFDFGHATIDASCFIDDDGTAYLYYVRDCMDNVVDGIHTSQIYGVQLDKTLCKIVSKPCLIATPSGDWETHVYPAPCVKEIDSVLQSGQTLRFLWNEAPSVIKHDGIYYLTYSVNCFDSKYYAVGVAQSNRPLSGFVKCEDNPAMQYIEGQISGTGHNSFFFDNSGSLYSAFHCHTHYDNPNGDRQFCYCPVIFEDGKLRFLYK